MNFRGTSHQRKSPGQSQAKHVRRGIDESECPVEMQRVSLVSDRKALREDDLKDIPSTYKLLGVLDRLFKSLPTHIAGNGQGFRIPPGGKGRHRERQGKFCKECGDPLQGFTSRFFDPEFTRKGTRHHFDPPAFVIKGHHGVGNHEKHLGNPQVIL
jgi:hypothetical protein